MRYDPKLYTPLKRIPVPRQKAEFSARFVVKEVAMRQVFLRVRRFSLSISFYQCSTHTHLHLQFALARRTKGRKVETFIEGGCCGNLGALDRQSFPLFPPAFQNVKLLFLFICSVLRHVRNTNRRF